MRIHKSKKYDVLYIDPPWEYRDKAKAGNRGAESHYPVLTLDELKKLPIRRISKPNSAIYLWATFPLLQEALELLKSWQYTYKTVAFVWVKTNKVFSKELLSGIYSIEDLLSLMQLVTFKGMGHYTRANVEVVLLGTRGKSLPVLNKSISQVVFAPRGEHSEKPEEVRNRIEQMYGSVDKVELFARKVVPNWTAIGNEIDGKDIRDVLK